MTLIDNSRFSHFAQATLCFSSVPEMPQIAFVFVFACNQLNGNSVNFGKRYIIRISMCTTKLSFHRFVEID